MTDGAFRPLPRPDDAAGKPRCTGVEIEFAGLDEGEAADLVADHLGGSVKKDGPHKRVITGSDIGTVEIVLDTALRHHAESAILDAGLDALRGLVPVEIVTEPLDRAGLRRLDDLRDALRAAGAIGTADGLALGFGVHLNVAVTHARSGYTCRTILAFGLLEDWLRRHDPIDITRRIMPFVQPWPRDFLDAMAEPDQTPDFETIRALYAEHCNSRNHALDLLPIFAQDDADAFGDLFPKQTNTKGRPAFHFRLPDCRVDQPDWALNDEWQRWWQVEHLAAQPDLLDSVRRAYLDRGRSLLGDRAAWADVVADLLSGRDGFPA